MSEIILLCTKCLENLPISAFGSSLNKSGFPRNRRCRKCLAAIGLKNYYKDHELSKARLRKHAKSKYESRLAYRESYYRANRDTLAQKKKARRARPEVKARDRAKSLEWQAANPDWRATNRAKNIEKIREQNRVWRENNPERARINQYNAHKRAYRRNPLRYNFSGRITKLLKNCGGKRSQKTEAIIGYSFAQLRAHIERQFTKKMNWDNHGEYWELDHIIPISHFKYSSVDDPEFKAAWAITNLRPLEKTKNRIKHAKRELLL